ncbi:MAG TPA: hypothetical protein VE869_00840 [Gemmatimonas sp.]|nr:hypothetical protein [Gemmatimonas sp.]
MATLSLAALTPLSSQQRAATFRTFARFTSADSTDGFAVAPTGALYLVRTPRGVGIREVRSGRITPLTASTADDFVWAPLGDRLAWWQRDDSGKGHIWTATVSPVSGALTSAPQRVSLSEASGAAAISPDGRSLAYIRDGSTSEAPLLIIPITGGPEREVARVHSGWDLTWSADGRSVYLRHAASGAPGNRTRYLSQVYLDGRPMRRVRDVSNVSIAGMTGTGSAFVLISAGARVRPTDSLLLVDTLGREIQKMPLPMGAIVESFGVIGDSMLVWEDATERAQLARLSLQGDKARTVITKVPGSSLFKWSPDGGSIAFMTRDGNQAFLGVMNADGSNVRHFRDLPMLGNRFAFEWSPDSRHIAIKMADRARISIIAIGGPGSFKTGVLTDGHLSLLRWSSDNRSLLVGARPSVPGAGTVLRIAMDGAVTPAGTLPARDSTDAIFWFSDSSIVRTGAGAVHLHNIRSGVSRRLYDIPAKTTLREWVVSENHGMVATLLRREDNTSLLRVVDLKSNETRDVSLPFWFMPPGAAAFSPDGKRIYTTGRQLTDPAGANIYEISLDGERPRRIVNLDGLLENWAYALAPDARSLLISTAAEQESRLLLVPLKPTAGRTTPPRRQ